MFSQEGRQSGDAEWIASRGEDGDESSGPDRNAPADKSHSCPMIGAPLGVLQQPGGGLSLSVAAVLSDDGGRAGGSVLVGGANVCRAKGRRVLCATAVSASTGVLVDSRVFFGGVGGPTSASDAVVAWLSRLPDSVVIAVAASGWATAIDSAHEKSGFEAAMNALVGGGNSGDGSPAAGGQGKGGSWTLLGWKGMGSHKWARRQYRDGNTGNESGSRCASYVELFFCRPLPENAAAENTAGAAPKPTRVELQDKLCVTPLSSWQAPQALQAPQAEEVTPSLCGSVKTVAPVASAPAVAAAAVHESNACCFPVRGICFREGEPVVSVGPTVELVECKGWSTVLEACSAGSEDSVVDVGAWRLTTVSAAFGGCHDDTERFDDAAFG